MRKKTLQKRRKDFVNFSSLEEEAEEPLLREVIYEFSIYMVLVIQYFEREFTLSIL
jgi:hypothetical protein